MCFVCQGGGGGVCMCSLVCVGTPCIHVLKFSAGAPVTARPSRSRQTQNIDPCKLHRFTSNIGIAPLTDHHGWNGEAFLCLVG